MFGKVIPAYIKEMKDDERFVDRDEQGNFLNVFIRKAELEGKIGSVEIEANENLPITWMQMRDIIMQLMQANNPQILAMLAQPENLPLIYEAIGLTNFMIPGEDSRNKQYDEIKALLNSVPVALPVPVNQQEVMLALEAGLPTPEPQVIEESSVPVEEFDNHSVELQTCIKWLNSEAGRLNKTENPEGYKNVLLHARAHQQALIPMQQEQQQPSTPADGKKPTEQDREAPIMGDENVPIQT